MTRLDKTMYQYEAPWPCVLHAARTPGQRQPKSDEKIAESPDLTATTLVSPRHSGSNRKHSMAPVFPCDVSKP